MRFVQNILWGKKVHFTQEIPYKKNQQIIFILSKCALFNFTWRKYDNEIS